jgi:GNAT superfamily N-acetyltransferase
MTQSEYAVWLAATIPAYAADKVASGQRGEDPALELSKKEYGELLPQGPETPENHLFTILDREAVPVGVLWLAVKTKFNARIAFVLDVSVSEGRRRQGHSRRALLALEDGVRKLGLSGIALHVFRHNVGWRRQSLTVCYGDSIATPATTSSGCSALGPVIPAVSVLTQGMS